MRPRETLTHGTCHVCSVCGNWFTELYPCNVKGETLWMKPYRAPPEAVHHRQPSAN